MQKNEIVTIFKLPGEEKQKNLIKKLSENASNSLDLLKELWDVGTSIDVRRWVVEAVGEFDSAESRKIISSALTDPAMSVRLHALRAVFKIGNKRFAEKILPLVGDESGGIRMNALDVIYGLKVRGYKALIEKLTNDPKDYIRKRAKQYSESLKIKN